METIALYMGYLVITIACLVFSLLMIMKISDYTPTPRRWLYKKMGQLAKKEPDTFLNMMIFFKRKYNLKHKSL